MYRYTVVSEDLVSIYEHMALFVWSEIGNGREGWNKQKSAMYVCI